MQKSVLLFLGLFFAVFLVYGSVFAAAPTVVSVTESSAPTAGGGAYYDLGETLELTVVFSESIDITGTPQLKLEVGGKVFSLDYLSGTGSNMILFSAVLPADFNDWGTVTADEFVIDGSNIIENAGNESVLADFVDIDVASIQIDTDDPVWESIEWRSTGGSVVGDTRYINSDDSITFTFTIASSDTREAATLTTTLSSESFTVTTGSNSTGQERDSQASTNSGDLDNMNGEITSGLFSLLNWQDKAGRNATGTPTYEIDSADIGVSHLVVDTTVPVITITNPDTSFAESKIVSASKDEADDTLEMKINASGVTTCDNTILDFVVYAETTFSTEADNGKSICYKATDYAGNETYELSSVIAGIDTENPVITTGTDFDTPENLLDVITVVASDSGSTVSFSITGGDDQGSFVLSGVNDADLKFSGNPDFDIPGDTNGDNIYTVEITATDEAGHTDIETFTLTLTDENEAPEISSNGGGATASVSTPENQVSILTVEASDSDIPAQDLEFSVSGGADSAKFAIVADTGVLTFVTSPDFETPSDLGDTAGNNTYEVEVTVTDNGTGTLTDSQIITVSVTDVDEIQPFIVISDNKPENTVNIASGDITFTIQFTNGDGGSADAVTGFDVSDIVVTGGTPAASFASGTSGSDVYTLVVTPDADFEGNITLNIAAEAATDLTENKSLEAIEYVQVVDTLSPTLSASVVANGTPNQLTLTFSEAVNVTDATGVTITVVDSSGFVLETKTVSGVSGTGTDTLIYTLDTPFQAEQIIKLNYVSISGDIQDLAENPVLDISSQSVTNNIAEGSAILEDILLTSSTTNPSSEATITWNTKTNVNGVAGENLVTTDNEIQYGTSQLLGQTESATGGSAHSATLSGLTPNTVYYYRVQSITNGKTSTSQIFSFTTSRSDTELHTDATDLIQSLASYDAVNPYTNGWHFRFNITIDNLSETSLQFFFDNWVSGTNALATTGNVKMLVSSTGSTPTEAEIVAGASVSTTYAAGDTVDISGIMDGNPNIAGKQLVLDLYIKIPDGQAGGSYSTSYGIKTF